MPAKLNLYYILIMVLILDSACTSERVYEGIYTWGAEVETFSPCGTGKDWWVITEETLSHQLSSAHRNLTSEPYEGIYVRVIGFYAGPADEDTAGYFATQYEGLFRINKVLSIRKQSASDCKS